MDTNQTKPTEQQTNIKTVRWKLPEFRKNIVQKCIEEVMKHSGCHLSGLDQFLERFEAKVNAAAKNEVEYIHWISGKVKEICSQLKTADPKPRLSNSTGSRETFSAQDVGKSANIDWKEQVFQKVQRMKSIYFPIVNAIYQQINRKHRQLESSPQESTTGFREKFRKNKKTLEYILEVLGVSKCQITTEFKERLYRAEKFLLYNLPPKNVSSHHKGQHLAHVQSKQQYGPSHSSISPVKINETKSSSQALGGTQNYPMTKDISHQNNKCLEVPKVEKQNSNSQQDVNQLSIIKGTGNSVQQQTQGPQNETEEFSVSVNSRSNSASPLIENCNKLKETSHKPTLISDEPSTAVQRFLKVLTSISPETLSASVDEIREMVYLNDVIPASESINRLQKIVQQQKQPRLIPQNRTNLASDIEPCSKDRYASCNHFVPSGSKRSFSIITMTAFGTPRIFASSRDNNQLTDAEKPDLTSVTSKIKKPRIMEKCSLLEEIKKINNLLIDSEIVIGEKDSILSASGGAAEDSEGLVIKFLFNAATVNQNLIFHLSVNQKLIIKPLWFLVPTSYPLSPPVILDKLPLEVSDGLKDLSTLAKLKLRFSLHRLNKPWSLGDIAMLWERCAREAILEYAQIIGGGTFSSKYGGWEMCQN